MAVLFPLYTCPLLRGWVSRMYHFRGSYIVFSLSTKLSLEENLNYTHLANPFFAKDLEGGWTENTTAKFVTFRRLCRIGLTDEMDSRSEYKYYFDLHALVILFKLRYSANADPLYPSLPRFITDNLH